MIQSINYTLLTLILMITTIVVLIYLIRIKCMSKHQDLQIFVLNLNKYG